MCKNAQGRAGLGEDEFVLSLGVPPSGSLLGAQRQEPVGRDPALEHGTGFQTVLPDVHSNAVVNHMDVFILKKITSHFSPLQILPLTARVGPWCRGR